MVHPLADEGSAAPPAKKRVASRHLVKGDSSDSEDEYIVGQEKGNFKRASDEVLASRRIVKIRRTVTPASTTSVPNPFSGISLVTPAAAEVSSSFAPSAEHPFPGVQLSPPPSLSSQEDISVPSNPSGATDPDFESKPSKSIGSVTEVASTLPGKATDGVVEECILGEQETEAVKRDVGNFMTQRQDKIVENKETEANLGENNEWERKEVEEEEKAGNTEEVGNIQDGGGTCVKEQQDDKFDKEGEGKACQQQQQHASAGGVPSPFVFGQLSSGTNVFSGTGLSSSLFPSRTAQPLSGTISGFASFGSSSAFGSGSAFRTGSVFGLKGDNDGGLSSMPSSLANSNGTTPFQLFGSQANTSPSDPLSGQQVVGSVSMQEVPVETGEELEKAVFAADATLFEFLEGVWKERGKGELKVNVPAESEGRPRLLMRSKGNYRLLLNASLFPDMKMASMDSRGVTFACVNSAVDAKKGLATYAVKLKDSLAATSFREAVDSRKGNPSANLRTPENSPRAPH